MSEAASRPGELGPAVLEQFRSFIARDPDWPLLFYEFWSYGVRNPRLRKELDRRRQAVRAAFAELVEAVAEHEELALTFPSDEIAGYAIWTFLESACKPRDEGQKGRRK